MPQAALGLLQLEQIRRRVGEIPVSMPQAALGLLQPRLPLLLMMRQQIFNAASGTRTVATP